MTSNYSNDYSNFSIIFDNIRSCWNYYSKILHYDLGWVMYRLTFVSLREPGHELRFYTKPII